MGEHQEGGGKNSGKPAVVMKMEIHCDACAKALVLKFISKIKGVKSVKIDSAKDLVVVTGTMEVKDLVPHLQTKLKRPVAIDLVPPKKDEGGASAEVPGGDGGEKKKGDGKDGGEKKMDDGERKMMKGR